MREGWKEEPVGNYVKLQQGFALNKKSDHYISTIPTEFPLLKISDLINGTKTLFVKESIPKQFLFFEDELIYSRTGQVGLIFIGKRGVVYNNCFKIKPTKELDPNFLFYFLKQQHVISYAQTLATGTAQPDLNHGAFKSIKILFPESKETQRKIASILSGYDDLIENNLKRIKILEEMAQQTYEEWFVRMRFPGYETAVMNEETGLPVGWEKVKLGDVCDLQQGFALNKKSAHYISKTKTDFPLLKISDLINQTETLFVKENIPNQFKIDYEDIIYSRTGQVGLAFIGKKGIAYNNCFKVKPFDENLKYYLLQFLRQPLTIEIAKSLATGTAQPDLNHPAFKSINFLKANDDIVLHYSNYYKDTIRIIQNLQSQNQRLREARDLLLPRLMMGIVEV